MSIESSITVGTVAIVKVGRNEVEVTVTLTAFLRPPDVPRHAGFPRGEHRGSRHRFL